jgi:Bacterial protein of unknown function (DUF885)
MVGATGSVSADDAADWVARSDGYTARVTEYFARYSPEMMSRLGVESANQEVMPLSLDVNQRALEEGEAVVVELERRLAAETGPKVRQDLRILIQTITEELEKQAAEERTLLPYFRIHRRVFIGLQSLLDEQSGPERRSAALVRLRRYAGREEGYQPLALLAREYIRHDLGDASLLGPVRSEVELDLARAPRFLAAIPGLFEEAGLEGWREDYDALAAQLGEYESFLRSEVLPRSREDFRLPPELYALLLREFGVDFAVEELASRAKVAFREIQNEMQTVAALVAEQRGWESPDYRDVIRGLRSEQLEGEALLEYYRNTIERIEELVVRERVATLPSRPLRMRLASEGEAAAIQAATIRWPQLLGEAAAYGEIILPMTYEGGEGARYDDFTHAAAARSLVVHEGRPGHELQLASMNERGISKARAFFAFNSTNVEGWALYAESEMKPYLPLDAQLVSLQHRLLRAARAFLDPGLQRSEITTDEARRLLVEDVLLSEGLAEQEIERYTTDDPGQATSYFAGHQRMLELRADVERVLGERFDRKAFNDFIVGQGLVPPALLRRAVMDEFVPAARSAAASS